MMKSELLISPDKVSHVQLASGEYWLRLVLSLADEFTGGDVVRCGRHATIAVEGADALASAYNRVNWFSGIASGAFYAFRTLHIPRQYLVLTELSGRLRASDMEAVASGSAIAIAKLVEKELPNSPAEGWTVQARVAERPVKMPSESGQDRYPNSGNGETQDFPAKPLSSI